MKSYGDAAARARELVGVTVWPALQATAAQLEAAVSGVLGAEAWEAARARGRAMSLPQALAYAVDQTA